MYGIEIPKQRGIFSEILTTEDTENLRVSLFACFDTVFRCPTPQFLPLRSACPCFRKCLLLDLMEPPCAKSMRSSRSPAPSGSRGRPRSATMHKPPCNVSNSSVRSWAKTSTALTPSTRATTPRSEPTLPTSTPRSWSHTSRFQASLPERSSLTGSASCLPPLTLRSSS